MAAPEIIPAFVVFGFGSRLFVCLSCLPLSLSLSLAPLAFWHTRPHPHPRPKTTSAALPRVSTSLAIALIYGPVTASLMNSIIGAN